MPAWHAIGAHEMGKMSQSDIKTDAHMCIQGHTHTHTEPGLRNPAWITTSGHLARPAWVTGHSIPSCPSISHLTGHPAMPCVINLLIFLWLKKKINTALGSAMLPEPSLCSENKVCSPRPFLQKCFLVLTVSRGTDLRMCQPVGHAEGRALKGGTGQEAEPICRRLLWALGNWSFSCFSHIVGVTLSIRT